MKAVLTGMREGIKTQERFIIREDRSKQNREMNLITVFPKMRYQTIQGFGGALTDAAGYVYSLMSEADRAEMIRTYFDPKEMNYTWGRTSIDSCDFSSEMYAADNDPEDPELSKMDYTRAEKNLLPLLRDAEKAAGQPLKLMLTPWTPPAWMKTNQSRTGAGRIPAGGMRAAVGGIHLPLHGALPGPRHGRVASVRSERASGGSDLGQLHLQRRAGSAVYPLSSAAGAEKARPG